MADQPHLLASLLRGPQRLAQALRILRDHRGRGGEDMRGGAIILLQPDHLGARKILLEPQDVPHLGPAPAIDRLVIVAHAADILVPLRQQPQPEVLGDVGILILVDEDVAEPALILGQHVWVRLKDGDNMQQQVTEIDGIQAP